MQLQSIKYSIFTLLITSLVITFIWLMKSNPTITFFPLDERLSFNRAITSLTYSDEKDKDVTSPMIKWLTESSTDEKIYLRQDASLLFANGRLRGVKSKWMERAKTIRMKEKLRVTEDTFWEGITFHHGEIHYPSDKIKSIQKMSHDQMYVLSNKDNQQLIHFKSALTAQEKYLQQQLNERINKQLLKHWNDLFKHFHINRDDYIIVPLTQLYTYEQTSLPSLEKVNRDQMIGRLWEGLYKNYIIPATNTQNSEWTNYMPIILFDKNDTHLLVLFELNGTKEKLLQRYPTD
ncbi:MAG TPA: hypothetical protein VF095_07655 [Bacillota bacterium]